jgi:hypothetical protein
MYVVYAHTAKGSIFYVGAGSEWRPYTRHGRGERWHETVDANHKRFGVRILSEHSTRKRALRAEAKAIRTIRPIANFMHNRPPECQPVETATVSLTPDDARMVNDLKARLRIFKTTDLIRYALRSLERKARQPESQQ